MKPTTSEAFSLIQRLLDKHYEETENTIRKFKWLTKIPQHGEEYVRHLNVWELQDKAIKELKEEKESINKLMQELYENSNGK